MRDEHAPTPDFAELLRRARRASGWSQEELAERAGVSARAISALERGVNRAPRRDTLDMLADALALPGDERRRWEQLRRAEARRAATQPARATHAASAPPNNLPPQPTRFFGRETELANLARLLRGGDAQLVTVTGPGGTGKTRLALQAAAALLDDFPQGVYFVDLAPISDAQRVLPTVAATLGVRTRADQPLGDTLAEWLDGQRLLLVLDNCEQVLPAAPALAELLGRCPAAQAIATSRAPLRVRAEREFPASPLPLPPAEPPGDAQAAGDNAAIELFVDRARAVRPDLTMLAEDVAVVARICRQLDGLPLALELAAACVRLLPPSTILERLVRQQPLLADGPRDAPARQRTLRATLAWSYDLLDADAQALLRRLSIFKGGWTLEAAEAVAAGVDGAPLDVFAASATLAEHSLIQSHVWLDGSPRFTMLETVRVFGLEQLARNGELEPTQQHQAAYFLRLFSGAAEHLRGPTFQQWLQRGDAEIENVRLALDWATTGAPELGLRLAREAGWYLMTRGAFIEARQRLERALAAAGDIADDLRAGALADMGMHATTFGDFESARADVAAALALYQRLEDASGIAECVHLMGRIAMWSDDNLRAVELFDEAIGLFRAQDSSTLTVACANLGGVLIELGELDAAATILAEGLAHSERRGDIWAGVLILGSLGDVELRRGDLARTREAYRRGMLLLRDLQDPRYIAQSLVTCAAIALAGAAAEQAALLLGAASHLYDTLGQPFRSVKPPEYEQQAVRARAQLSDAAWNQAWAVGQSLSQSDAIEAALEGLT